MWTVLWLVLSGLTTFAIAAVVVGREARRLDAIAPRAVYDPDEAGAYVMHQLSGTAGEHLTPEELHDLLSWHLGAMRRKGLQPPKAVDQRQSLNDEPVVVDEDVSIGELIARAELADLAVPDEVIAEVMRHHLNYLGLIGAIGVETSDPDVVISGQLTTGTTKALGREQKP
jgi:hypothetical protein